MEFTQLWLKYFVIGSSIFYALAGYVVASLLAIELDGFTSQCFDWCLVGVVVAASILAYSGCSGAHHVRWLWTYAILLILYASSQITIGIRYQPNDFARVLIHRVEGLWQQELKRFGPLATVEQKYECCGLHGANDYVVANLTLPRSCYKNYNHHNPKLLFDKGCWDKCITYFTYLADNARIVNDVMIGFEAITLLISCMLIWRRYEAQQTHRNLYTQHVI